VLASACGGGATGDHPPAASPPFDGCVGRSDGTIVSMTASDGQKINGALVGTGTAGVVLGHQGNKNLCSWITFATLLAGRGYMALALDFRGYGHSDLAPGKVKQTAADLDVAAGVAELRRRGVQRVIIIGASLGALGAVIAAATIEPKVQGVVQISGPAACCSMDAAAAVPKLRVPILYVVSKEDAEVYEPIKRMYADTAVTEKKLLELEGSDHGTDILDGEHARELSDALLAFVTTYAPAS
jgi:pimeloyl-ACP methyl ester carboxylesterase